MSVRFRSTIAAATLLAAVLTGCSAGSDTPEGSSTEQSPTSGIEISHVHGLGINPGDEKLYIASHHGIIAVDGNGSAKRMGDSADYMGFTVTGADTFLGSGHPASGSGDHANRGLIKSTDAGKTWQTLSLAGQADFHALEWAHGTIYGYDSTNGLLRVSKDGKNWEDGAELAALDIAVSPESPGTVLATTENGVAQSTDGGKTFTDGARPVMAFLSWAEQGELYGVDLDGALHRSPDGGKSWTKTGTVPGGQPQALTAVGSDHVLAATAGGVYESEDGGKTFTRRLAMSDSGH
ncbi:exo-alpha-sialidase [Streptomyces sp. H28]|uniref:F510_1955 family glycosylhydrolase n=1 Tax=unclassified Streptomyces TaxID=2593676 RepID=UPI001781D5FE|nr:exo-alpha-sialidase [Streptomyces sp. H28]MBD9731393.1 exo-alpha-sialidase [Streptomyces sp. H28]MBM7087211.1 exo-alpha-sialidase [Streptomyces sp. S12]